MVTHSDPASEDPRLANLLGAVARAVADEVDDATAAFGLSHSDLAALNIVCQWPGGSVRVLAGGLRLTHPATVRVVDRLEQRGLVERRPSGRGRTLGLFPSRAGTLLGRRVAVARLRRLARLLAPLDVRERAALAMLLERMLGSAVTSVEGGDSVCRMCCDAACPTASCPVGLAQDALRKSEVAP